MKPIDYVIIAVVAVAVVGVVVYLIRQKKKGKSGCGCGCNGCPHAGACNSMQKADKDSTEGTCADVCQNDKKEDENTAH